MGWEEVIKSRENLLMSYDISKKRLEREFKKLINHPDYDLEETISKIDKQLYRATEIDENTGESMKDEFAKKVLRGEIEPGDRGGIIDYIHGKKHEGEPSNSLLTYAIDLLDETWLLFKKIYMGMADFKSRGFLGEVAKTFGVVLDTSPHNNFVLFRHKGLRFELHQGGIEIQIPRTDMNIEICVVDERRLPLGDFYASMLGLIVAKPSELDVVNFGIQLALIILSYDGYHWLRAYNVGESIGIYTPFNGVNPQNRAFGHMLDFIMNDDHDLAPDILEEIEGALEDCFGSTRGFFE